MKRLAAWLLLGALVLLGLQERLSGPHDPARGVAGVAAGSAAAQRDAWFLRAIELTLATGSVPREDRFLDGGEARVFPWTPFFPALVAGVLRRTALSELGDLELGALSPRRLESWLERWLPLLGAVAVVAVFFTARALQAGEQRDLAGLLAAGAYALSPSILWAERTGRVEPFALQTLLGCALIGASLWTSRAREPIDATLGGLLAGLAAGLALASGLETLPVVLAAAVSLGAGAWRDRGAALTAFCLCAVSATLTAFLAIGPPSSWWDVLPARAAWNSARDLGPLRLWLPLVVLPASLVALLAPGRTGSRGLVRWLLIASLVWALVFDAQSSAVQTSACLGLGVAGADRAGLPRSVRAGIAALSCVILLAPAQLLRRDAVFAPLAQELAARAAWGAGLDWMRAATPSSGPWNHPAARPDWFVLVQPAAALEVAVRARRAVLAAAPRGLRARTSSEERSARAVRLLETPASTLLLEQLRALRVRYVIVGPALPAAPGAAPDALHAELARSEPDGAPDGFERVWASAAQDDGRPLISIWALGAVAAPNEPSGRRPR